MVRTPNFELARLVSQNTNNEHRRYGHPRPFPLTRMWVGNLLMEDEGGPMKKDARKVCC